MRVDLISLIKTGQFLTFNEDSQPADTAAMPGVERVAHPGKDVMIIRRGNVEFSFVKGKLRAIQLILDASIEPAVVYDDSLPLPLGEATLKDLLRREQVAYTVDNKVIPQQGAYRLVFPSGVTAVVHGGVVTRIYRSFT
ncbi:hypothetical protein [Calidithermus chliarophilus]|uniref:hypothetical protein n=1 Tax=Calidithermus chliarophilus TaxID=52023 RepID=UPI00048796E8|nr:hypothetical protein [Calidithermus chliarophilus]